MKTTFKNLALPFMIMTAFVYTAKADPVNINITGNVVASPCKIDSPGNIPVGLADTQATALAEAGSKSAPTEFEIKLSACPTGTTHVTLTFSGAPDSATAAAYASTGSAENVVTEIYGSTNGLPKGNGSTETYPVEADHTVDFHFKANAYSKGNATPGTIISAVQVSFTYQ